MTKLQTWLYLACQSFALQIEFNTAVCVCDALTINAIALIVDASGSRRMIVVSDFSQIQGLTETLLSAGFGFSVLDEPMDDENFNLDSFRELFDEWGFLEGDNWGRKGDATH